jgi:hypothetical protein
MGELAESSSTDANVLSNILVPSAAVSRRAINNNQVCSNTR